MLRSMVRSSDRQICLSFDHFDYHVSMTLVKCENFRQSVSVSMILVNFTMSSSNQVVHSSSCSFFKLLMLWMDSLLYT